MADHQVGDVYQPENQRRGQSRFPGPPNSPNRFGPDHAGNQRQRDEYHAHLRGGVGHPVPDLGAPYQVADAGHGADQETEEGQNRDWYVDVENALDVSQHLVGGGDDENEVAVHQRQYGGDEQQPKARVSYRRAPKCFAFRPARYCRQATLSLENESENPRTYYQKEGVENHQQRQPSSPHRLRRTSLQNQRGCLHGGDDDWYNDGKKSTGSRISRERVCAAIPAKNVPTVAKPMVASRITSPRAGDNAGSPSITANMGSRMASITSMNTTLLNTLPRKMESRLTGAASNPSSPPCSISRENAGSWRALRRRRRQPKVNRVRQIPGFRVSG